MTFTIKVRGTGPMVAEYMCPWHGRFDLVVARGPNGDAPTVVPCEHVTGHVATVEAPDHVYPVLCGKPAEYCISAPRMRILTAKPTAVTRGKADDRPSPLHMDHSAVADGKISMGEWQEQRNKVWEEHRLDQVKKAVS